MADTDLLQALDYILNHSDDASIEVLAEAVVRRRRNLTVFHAMGDVPDPQKMAKEITAKISSGFGGGVETMRRSIQEMIVRIIREHAPELNENQIDELLQAWLPNQSALLLNQTETVPSGKGGKSKSKKSNLPPDVLLSMIEQFVSFSHGTMQKNVDKSLREEMGAWPERYWNAFPPVIRQITTDYLKDKITEKDFKSRIVIALGI